MKMLSDLIKNKRNELGISQKELAKRIDVNDSYIAKIESGVTKKPSVTILINLGRELKLSIFDLCNSAGYSKREMYDLFNIGANESNLLSDFDIVSEEDVKDFVYYDDDLEHEFIDIVKILKNYKSGKINEEKAVELINLCKKIYTNDNKVIYPSESGYIELEFPPC